MTLRIRIAGGLLGMGMLCGATAGHAQRLTSTIDIQQMQLRYNDTVRVSGTGVSSTLAVTWPLATLRASGNYTWLKDAWSTNGVLSASVFTPQRGLFIGEIAGQAGGSAHQDGTRTSMLLAQGRIHMMASTSGLWVGGGGGSTWDGFMWRGVRQGEFGAWLARTRTSVSLGVTPTVVDDSIRYTDINLSGRWTPSRFEFDVSTGIRAGAQLPSFAVATNHWGSVGATFWITPRIAVTGSAGTYPVDYTQGFPGGRFLLISTRFSLGSDRLGLPGTLEPSLQRIEPLQDSSALPWSFATIDGHRRVIRVFAPAAHSVELSGDFTMWRVLSLERSSSGWWSVSLNISPGVYQMNLRVDQGTWLVPARLPRVRDEFGGVAGVLTVP